MEEAAKKRAGKAVQHVCKGMLDLAFLSVLSFECRAWSWCKADCKLSIFIIIELVVFPLTIGGYINIAAMPIFPGMTFKSRFKDLKDGSFGTVFVLWMIGTM